VVRVRCHDPASGDDEDEDSAIQKLHDKLREEFEGVKKQMDERMTTLERSVASLDQKLNDIGRMLGELLGTRAS
jgi:chaperonin cofactor prefoldin